VLTTPGHYAYVKIAEGCDYTCAFCIIPTLRGQYRSRDEDSIVQEAESLAARGIRELLLISQDTTFFGIDRGERGALARLLRRLNGVAGLTWIRLLYLYPTTITDDVLDAMAECEKVCRFVDLPLQHASSAVLKRMRRPGTRASYDVLLARIRAKVPDVTLRTTFIVGFPGETDEDFEQTVSLMQEVGFDQAFIFRYSKRRDTPAADLGDQLPETVKEERNQTLLRVVDETARKRLNTFVGKRVQILAEGPSKRNAARMSGRTRCNKIVVFDGGERHRGELMDVEIERIGSFTLYGNPAVLMPN
jgi:MiaB/RimO family radical SAM methylthiotransferase